MARWRDIKQGRVTKPSKKHEPLFTPAPIPDRLKAFLTDTFMITMPIIYIVIYLVMGSREGFREHMGQGWLYIIIPHMIIVVGLWWLKGETPGMRAYDIKIVTLHNPKKRINIIQAILRYILMPISILSIVGILLPFFRKDKQTLHDILSWSMLIHDAK